MKKRSPRSTPSPQERFNQKLLGYSATAGAALLLTPATQAQTHNITSFSTNSGSTFSATVPTFTFAGLHQVSHFAFTAATSLHNLEIKGQFGFSTSRGTGGNGTARRLDFHPAAGNAIANTGGFLALALANQAVIAGHAFGAGASKLLGFYQAYSGLVEGNFFQAAAGGHKTGYAGFKTAGGDYGWLRIRLSNDSGKLPSSITFLQGSDGQYGEIGGNGLKVNDVSAIPEPASVATGLALFALGAAGVREHRRRKLAA